MRVAGLSAETTDDGALRVQATAEQVGRTAAAAGQILIELREHDSSSLEDLFFELTSAADHIASAA